MSADSSHKGPDEDCEHVLSVFMSSSTTNWTMRAATRSASI